MLKKDNDIPFDILEKYCSFIRKTYKAGYCFYRARISEKEGFDITKVDKKTLPTELRNMTDAQLKAYVDAKKKEREKLKNEIQVLNNAREYYIAQQKKENSKTSISIFFFLCSIFFFIC